MFAAFWSLDGHIPHDRHSLISSAKNRLARYVKFSYICNHHGWKNYDRFFKIISSSPFYYATDLSRCSEQFLKLFHLDTFGDKKKKKETRSREVLRLLPTSVSENFKGREIVDPFISKWNLWNILLYIPRVKKDRSRKTLEKRHNNLQPHNWRASCSGTCCQFLPKMEKFISLTSRSQRRQINSQKRQLTGIIWNTLL